MYLTSSANESVSSIFRQSNIDCLGRMPHRSRTQIEAWQDGKAPSCATPNNYLYRGEQWDPDLGLYYLLHLYYNPLTGRFLARDPKPGNPAYPRKWHTYLYAAGDPVDCIDPRGLEDTVELAGADSESDEEEDCMDEGTAEGTWPTRRSSNTYSSTSAASSATHTNASAL